MPTPSFKVGPGEFLISAHGNVFAKKSTLLQKIDKKARKLCDGRDFTYLSEPKLENLSVKTFINGQWGTSYSVKLSRTIRCNVK